MQAFRNRQWRDHGEIRRRRINGSLAAARTWTIARSAARAVPCADATSCTGSRSRGSVRTRSYQGRNRDHGWRARRWRRRLQRWRDRGLNLRLLDRLGRLLHHGRRDCRLRYPRRGRLRSRKAHELDPLLRRPRAAESRSAAAATARRSSAPSTARNLCLVDREHSADEQEHDQRMDAERHEQSPPTRPLGWDTDRRSVRRQRPLGLNDWRALRLRDGLDLPPPVLSGRGLDVPST